MSDDVELGPEPLEKIAVVAMTGRFPGAPSVSRLWERLCEGEDCVTDLTAADLIADGVDPAVMSLPDFVNRAGVLDDIDLFDAQLFGYSPREAEVMDPQQRIFLECAWEALELAGHVPGQRSESVGVYAGASMSGYGLLILTSHLGATYGDLDILINNDKDFLATRAAYKLGLKGPAMTVQTACSTSLVAIATAVEALRNYHCDLALAGGATVNVPHRQGYFYRPGGIASKDGYCRTFDARAGGTVGGNGVAIVALKRLRDAVEDGDVIHAVISGVGLNNDGSDKVGFTAPSVAGQAAAIAMAHAQAQVDAAEIGYVECHGTATPLGDPIEIAALRDVFEGGNAGPGTCAIGSIKSNLGHLDCAAGVAGLIKAVLCVEHGMIPASLYFETPNPQLGLEASPFFVATQLREWPGRRGRRVAGVSSFGIGGTNAHVVVEQAPSHQASGDYLHAVLLPVSARTGKAVKEVAGRLEKHLAAKPDLPMADVAFTLQTGRRRLATRAFVVAGPREDSSRLRSVEPHARTLADDIQPQIGFLIPGQGSQRAGTLSSIAAAHTHVMQDLTQLSDVFEPRLGFDVRRYLVSEAAEPVTDTRLVQPILFAQGYCLGRLLIHVGLAPDCLLGHSIGELVAAALAGTFRIEDAVDAVLDRAECMAAAPAGAMVALDAAPELVEQLLQGLEGAGIAAINGAQQTVASGSLEAMEALEARAAGAQLRASRLATSHAFHSASMEEASRQVAERFAAYPLMPPAIPFISNVTGDWIADAQAVDPAYWGSQVRSTVQFGAGLERLMAREGSLVFELGRGTLLGPAAARLARNSSSLPLALLPRAVAADGWACFLTALGHAWVEGAAVDWKNLYPEGSRGTIPLPTYPFERSRYWVNAGPGGAAPQPDHAEAVGLTCFRQSWTRQGSVPIVSATPEASSCVVVGEPADPLVEPLAEAWRARGWSCLTVSGYSGAPGAMENARVFILIDDPDTTSPGAAFLRLAGQLGAIDRQASGQATVLLVTRGLFDIVGSEAVRPEKAPLEALAICLPQESPNLRTALIDLSDVSGTHDWIAGQIVDCCLRDRLGLTNAFRGKTRWTRHFEMIEIPEAPFQAKCVLITGGLGRLGPSITLGLAKRGVRTLIVLGRSPDPALAAQLAADVEAAGSRLIVHACDLADHAAAKAVIGRIEEESGPIDGIIHAAGFTAEDGFRPLGAMSEALLSRHFAPKVHGTRNLVELLDGRVSWGILFSSISGSLGGLGFAAYAGANLYLDAVAAERSNAGGRTCWSSVQWDAFDERGVAGLTADAALRVIESVAGGGLPPTVIACAGDFESRIASWLYNPGAGASPTEAAGPVIAPSPHQRPALASAYLAPETDQERRMQAIWERLLGIGGLGVEDDFFELGGHSLLGVQLIGKVREAFDCAIPVSEIFEAPTIRRLVSRIEAISLESIGADG